MNKLLTLAAIAVLFLLLPGAFAASSQQAIDFVSKQNTFLTENETAGIFPDVKIRSSGKYFFVVTVLGADSSLAGFVPVSDAEPLQVPESLVARRELIKTAYVMRFEQQLRQSSSQQGSWIFDASSQKFFSDLADELRNEKVDLTTIKTELQQYSALQQDFDDLIEQLDGMRPVAADISDAIAEAIEFENGFISAPDTNRVSMLQSKFNNAFDLIAEADAMRSVYLADLDKAKQAIALTDLPIDTKRSLNSLADIPNKLSTQQFGYKANNATALAEKFDQLFSNATHNLNSLVEGLATRGKRNSSFQVLYGQSDELMKKTGQQSLQQLVNFIQHDDYVWRWKMQGSLSDMQGNWAKAENFYNNGSFDLAEQYAAKAKESALRVYEAGLEENGVLDTDLLFTGIILLVVALIILFALRNRKKLFKLVAAKQEQEEEMQIYEFEK